MPSAAPSGRCGACASRPSPSPSGFSLKHGPHIRRPRCSPEHAVAAPGVLRHESLGQKRVGVTVAKRSGVGQPLAAELGPPVLATKHTSHDRHRRAPHRGAPMVADASALVFGAKRHGRPSCFSAPNQSRDPHHLQSLIGPSTSERGQTLRGSRRGQRFSECTAGPNERDRRSVLWHKVRRFSVPTEDKRRMGTVPKPRGSRCPRPTKSRR